MCSAFAILVIVESLQSETLSDSIMRIAEPASVAREPSSSVVSPGTSVRAYFNRAPSVTSFIDAHPTIHTSLCQQARTSHKIVVSPLTARIAGRIFPLGVGAMTCAPHTRRNENVKKKNQNEAADAMKKLDRMVTKIRKLLKRAKSDLIEAERQVMLCGWELSDERARAAKR